MSLTREQIYQALFAIVTPLLAPGAVDGPPDGEMGADSTAAPGTPTAERPFNLVSREVVEVQKVPPALQPVLFMDEATEEYVDRGTGLVARKWTIYFHVGCTSVRGTAASSILNPLLDCLEAVLAETDGDLLGLGDHLESAQLGGMSVKDLGNNSTVPDARQAVAYVPFEIVFA